jgi:hypothetical protein
MRRDLDLVRNILLFFESRDSSSIMSDAVIQEQLKFEGFDYRDVAYHLRIMAQANLLTCEPVVSSTSDRIIKVYPFELTWDGHEFLQLSKDNSRWEKMKKQAGSSLDGISFEIVKSLLVGFAKKSIGL